VSPGRTRLSADAPLHPYFDASSVVKLVLKEDESDALRSFAAPNESWVSSEIVVAESARAVRRNAAVRPDDEEALLARLRDVVRGLTLIALDRPLLDRAGRVEPRSLRTIDAIHVATALALPARVSFVSYDKRRLEAARSAGLQTASPGAV